MELIKRICPDSPYVWDRNGVSKCFSNIVLGFGANVATLVIITLVGVTRSRRESRRIHLSAKALLFIIPALGACTTFFDIVVILRKLLNGFHIPFHEWLFCGSLFGVWVAVLLVSICDYWFNVFCNQTLCIWWIIKPFLWIPHLQLVFSLQEGLPCFEESFLVVLDVTFGILINVIKVKWASKRSRYRSCACEFC